MKVKTSRIRIILAIILVMITILGNKSYIKTIEASEPNSKQLVQCTDNWVIYRYRDAQNNVQFDIRYKGKTLDELRSEGDHIIYVIYDENGGGLGSKYWYSDVIYWDEIYDDILNKLEYCCIQFFIQREGKNISSYMIPICEDNKISPLVESVSYGVEYAMYDLTKGKTNKLKVSLRVSEHLKESGKLSVSKGIVLGTGDVKRVKISNLKFENYTDKVSVDGINKTIKYSMITYDLELPDKIYVPNNDDSEPVTAVMCYYSFRFNGVLGKDSNNSVKELKMIVITPTSDSLISMVNTLKFEKTNYSINVGKQIKLSPIILPYDATTTKLLWSSSNSKYAVVDSNGNVFAKKAGAGKTVTIFAKTTDGSNITSSIKLKINRILVKKIILKAPKTIKAGKKTKIKITINSDATNKTVKWSVNNKKYAKISSKGVLVTKKAGKGKNIKVTAQAKDGSNKKITVKIKIK